MPRMLLMLSDFQVCDRGTSCCVATKSEATVGEGWKEHGKAQGC